MGQDVRIAPRAGKVWVEVGKLAEGTAKILEEIQKQNALLRELLIFQEQSAIATALLSSWAEPVTNYLGPNHTHDGGEE
jgi:hypothetical protein